MLQAPRRSEKKALASAGAEIRPLRITFSSRMAKAASMMAAGQLKLAVVVNGEKVDVRSGHVMDSRKWAGLPTSSGSVRSAAVKGETASGRKRPPGAQPLTARTN
jgi:hypothetical protein